MLEKKFIYASDENGRQIYLVETPDEAEITAGDLVSVKRTNYKDKTIVTESLYIALCDPFTLDVHSSRYRIVHGRVTQTRDEMVVVALYAVTRYDADVDPDDSGDSTENTDSDGGDSGNSGD